MAQETRQEQQAPNAHEQLARIKKRDRILDRIREQALSQDAAVRAQPDYWNKVAAFIESADAQRVATFLRQIGERVSDTTLTETWPMVVAAVRSWCTPEQAA